MKRPTLLDVAREAGVSKATASRALNGMARVLPETRELVQNTARRLGYVPDPISKALAERRKVDPLKVRAFRGRLAYLDCEEHRISGAEAMQAREAAEQLGYDLEVSTIHSERVQSELNQLWSRGVEGLLIRGGHGRFPHIEEALLGRFSVVLVGANEAYGCAKVAFDFGRAVEEACVQLREMGAARIGLWLINNGSQREHLSAIGALLALKYRNPQDAERLTLMTSDSVYSQSTISKIGQQKFDALLVPSVACAISLQKIYGADFFSQTHVCTLYGKGCFRGWNFNFSMDRLQSRALAILTDLTRRDIQSRDRYLTLLPPVWGMN